MLPLSAERNNVDLGQKSVIGTAIAGFTFLVDRPKPISEAELTTVDKEVPLPL